MPAQDMRQLDTAGKWRLASMRRRSRRRRWRERDATHTLLRGVTVSATATVKSSSEECGYGLEYGVLAEHKGAPPMLPASWSATAVLHPFSPPPQGDPKPAVPFFQLCTAAIYYREGEYLSAQITGCEYGSWWYVVRSDGTQLSVDQGRTWATVDVGWTLPSTNWFGAQLAQAVCAGTSYLNWMRAQQVDWWKIPVAGSEATTWLWFDSATSLPFRLMFGQPPATPEMGDPAQLALFQMFSFTYFASFGSSELAAAPADWSLGGIPGFVPGNPYGYELVEWNSNFGMTTLMTPVDAASNPLPTRVLYRWASDADYKQLTDRAQSTLMWYYANPQSGLVSQTALMFGVAPRGVQPPPYSNSSFLIDLHGNGSVTCESMPFGQEPPWWARIPEVEGLIHACVANNPALCPGQAVAIISVLFPPTGEYPQGRYLWTWYSPFAGSRGSHARPVTFMESASTITEGGTSLALADYFDYSELPSPIEPTCFAIPDVCKQTLG
jgi:hypothetical protein